MRARVVGSMSCFLDQRFLEDGQGWPARSDPRTMRGMANIINSLAWRSEEGEGKTTRGGGGERGPGAPLGSFALTMVLPSLPV